MRSDVFMNRQSFRLCRSVLNSFWAKNKKVFCTLTSKIIMKTWTPHSAKHRKLTAAHDQAVLPFSATKQASFSFSFSLVVFTTECKKINTWNLHGNTKCATCQNHKGKAKGQKSILRRNCWKYYLGNSLKLESQAFQLQHFSFGKYLVLWL